MQRRCKKAKKKLLKKLSSHILPLPWLIGRERGRHEGREAGRKKGMQCGRGLWRVAVMH